MIYLLADGDITKRKQIMAMREIDIDKWRLFRAYEHQLVEEEKRKLKESRGKR